MCPICGQWECIDSEKYQNLCVTASFPVGQTKRLAASFASLGLWPGVKAGVPGTYGAQASFNRISFKINVQARKILIIEVANLGEEARVNSITGGPEEPGPPPSTPLHVANQDAAWIHTFTEI